MIGVQVDGVERLDVPTELDGSAERNCTAVTRTWDFYHEIKRGFKCLS